MADGPIMLAARAQIPATWDALARSSTYGPELLQRTTDVIKFRVFTTTAANADESSFYDPIELDYAGKLVAIQVIPAGADYWSDQLQSETTSGTNESISYPDRIASLWRIHARLLTETEQYRSEFQAQYGRIPDTRVSVPKVSKTGPLVTPDPWVVTAALYTTFPAVNGLLPYTTYRGAW